MELHARAGLVYQSHNGAGESDVQKEDSKEAHGPNDAAELRQGFLPSQQQKRMVSKKSSNQKWSDLRIDHR